MVKKISIYSKVNFKTLKKELEGIMTYLQSEKVDETLTDEFDNKPTKNGGIAPSVISSIEKKIETQLSTLDTCSKILKVIFEKEGLSDLVKNSIDTLTNKLEEIEKYYEEKPISEMQKRIVYIPTSKGTMMRAVAATREDRINSRTIRKS